MFTGIIQDLGEIKKVRKRGSALSLEIRTSLMDALDIGDSVATNGVCLTLSRKDRDSFQADVMPKTLEKTNLYQGTPGTKVNLEKALTLKDLLGGHLLLGHVDTRASILDIQRDGDVYLFQIPYHPDHGPYLIPQGSVSVDGISLTIAELTKSSFFVSIIPHTFSCTTFQFRKVGDVVNIEYDLLGKYIYRLVTWKGERTGGLNENFLREHGFF